MDCGKLLDLITLDRLSGTICEFWFAYQGDDRHRPEIVGDRAGSDENTLILLTRNPASAGQRFLGGALFYRNFQIGEFGGNFVRRFGYNFEPPRT